MKKKVGIITWHYYSNVGSALQAYGLQKKIEDLGYEVFIINYRNPTFGETLRLKENIKYHISLMAFLLGGMFARKWYSPFLQFQRRYLKESATIYKKSELPKAIKNMQVCVAGSDQIWAPNVLNSVYLLDFVPEKIKKVSYASSIGLDDIPENMIEQYKKLLTRFSQISVREDAGRDLLKSKCGINSKTVLDPTLLLDDYQWKKIEKTYSKINCPYIFCYFLNKNNNYRQKVKEYAKKRNLKLVGLSARETDAEYMEILNKVGPCEFIWLVDNAEVIFTDSYHGTIFSILFHKKFVTFERFNNQDSVCQNSRLYQLAEWFDIRNMIYREEDYNPYREENIDYEAIDLKLRGLREDSINYLKKSLQ